MNNDNYDNLSPLLEGNINLSSCYNYNKSIKYQEMSLYSIDNLVSNSPRYSDPFKIILDNSCNIVDRILCLLQVNIISKDNAIEMLHLIKYARCLSITNYPNCAGKVLCVTNYPYYDVIFGESFNDVINQKRSKYGHRLFFAIEP